MLYLREEELLYSEYFMTFVYLTAGKELGLVDIGVDSWCELKSGHWLVNLNVKKTENKPQEGQGWAHH